jgi:glycosyltransferase involved in cell wall biosynthesis
MNLIITRVLKYGGSNDYLTTLINYLGRDNVILILFEKNDIDYLKNNVQFQSLKYYFIPIPTRVDIRFTLRKKNLIDIYKYLFVYIKLIFICNVNSINKIFISVISQSSFLYFFTYPFISLFYVFHSEPKYLDAYSKYLRIEKYLTIKKQIITVSNSNKLLIIDRWKICENLNFINVVYNPINAFKNHFVERKYKKIKIVLTLGHVESYKNPFSWINIAKDMTSLFKDVYFLWIGDGSLFNECIDTVAEHRQIIFLGYRSNVSKYLEIADIYFLKWYTIEISYKNQKVNDLINNYIILKNI